MCCDVERTFGTLEDSDIELLHTFYKKSFQEVDKKSGLATI